MAQRLNKCTWDGSLPEKNQMFLVNNQANDLKTLSALCPQNLPCDSPASFNLKVLKKNLVENYLSLIVFLPQKM